MCRFNTTLLLASAIGAQYGNAAEVTVDTLLETSHSWDGKQIDSWPKGKPVTRVLKYTIAPNSVLPWHFHPAPNVAYVVKGHLVVELKDGTKKEFAPGDAFEEVIGTVHRGRNIGQDPVELIVFQATAQGFNNTVKVK